MERDETVSDEERLSTGQQKITGYRDLTEEEISLINRIKDHGEATGKLVNEIFEEYDGLDRRWASIAKTHFQEGFMALVRSIAKPEGF